MADSALDPNAVPVSKVLVIYTGGTIGMMHSPKGMDFPEAEIYGSVF
tara:strand:+ start:170 stop:310 length:141 start_codon:yes stop_codon:yes gene_type:complete